MKRVKLTVAYDGTNYHGWQIQPNGNTIEEELNRHLSELLKEEINKYLNYCKFQKELNDKTIKAYKADLEQFISVIGENNPD